ncbi:MAG: catechol 2,3-dioxygenase-like lactoylglutathione lyase family enzyme [Dokdonia sp.]|jgi:catechol 2,3-dioxygenase-like lactoylglutathione lyase family enzyme
MSQKVNNDFNIEFLDHVAIRVKDVTLSAKWYADVLGLKKVQLEKWGSFPIFMLSGKSGVALFPSDIEKKTKPLASKDVKIDHFAFHVTAENFEKAKAKFTALGIAYKQEDHHYFYSIYIKDPDDHTVELTTIKVDASEFYNGSVS